MNAALQEFKKFSSDALERMKSYSDDTHKSHEWMSYVYDVNGTYELGEPSYGGESKITIDPEVKMAEDNSKHGFPQDQRMWTIHGHPLKDGDIYNGRQFFSSTDIIEEFIQCRDNDTYIVQFLVHPHQQVDKATGETVIHNRVRTLVFPGRDVVVAAMKKSNPHVDPYSITVDNGTNRNAGGDLVNDAGVAWFALDGAPSFQKTMEDMGYVSVVDLEGPGAKTKSAEGFGVANITQDRSVKLVVALAIAGGLLSWYFKGRGSTEEEDSEEEGEDDTQDRQTDN